MSVRDAFAMTGQIAEGVKSSESVLALARKHGVEMPITEVVAAVMHEGLAVGEAAAMLASRSAKPEWYGS
jgi:glycerol-3-phosphate dehydrogenase (NAD(P)+)